MKTQEGLVPLADYLAVLDELESTKFLLRQTLKELEELKSRLNKSSKNSSKPPSSDGLKKMIKNNREKSTRKPGAQPGHKGSTLSVVEQPDEIIPCKIEKAKCECGHSLQHIKAAREEKRQVIDIADVLVKVVEYLVEVKKCKCGKEHKATCEFEGRVQYGKKIKSLLTYLNVYQMLPNARIQELCRDLFGLSVGDGTIQSGSAICYNNLQETEEDIKQALIASPVIHVDETGMRCNGTTQWAHSCSNEKYTLYGIHQKRGNEGIDAMGIMQFYSGTCVHDRWASYDKYSNCVHALCNAHLLRDLKFMYEEEGKKWAGRLIELLQKANERKKEARISNHFSTRLRNQISGIVSRALRNEPKEKNVERKRGRRPKSKPIRLLEVFKNRLDDILLFLTRDDIPFDNNLAERDIRMVKLKQKISGCFRTEKGAQLFCRIRSYISTSRKQNQNIWNALTQALEGKPIKFAC